MAVAAGPDDDADAVLRFRDGAVIVLPLRDTATWPNELRVSVQPGGGFEREWFDIARPRAVTAHVFTLTRIESGRLAYYDEVA
jgi:hypothetical protein